MPYGITPTGFVPKPLQDIKTELEGDFRTVFGASISLIAQSVFGLLIGIMSEKLAELWQLGLATYTASTREGASGIQLDNIGALSGSIRLSATFTKVDILLTGTPATVIPTGRILSIPSTGAQFTNDVGGVIGGGGTVTLEFRATVTGPVTAYANTVTNIVTPVVGLTSVNNPLDHKLIGTNTETDAAFRIRQLDEIKALGLGTVAGIRSQILKVSGVTQAVLFENTTDMTDANGLPPHSFESVVVGGLDADIAKAIADSKPAGIATHGLVTQATTDANGHAVSIKFSRATIIDVYVKIFLTVDESLFPTNGEDLLRAAIADFGDLNYKLSSEVRAAALIPPMFSAGVGVLECQLPLIGLAPSPGSSTTLQFTNRQLPDLDSSPTRVELLVTKILPT